MEDKFNYTAFFGGVTFVLALYFIGEYISNSIAPVNLSQSNAILWVSIFIGLSMGHYIGKAITKGGGTLNSFLVGIFVTLTLFTIAFVTGVSNLTGVMIFLTISVFLMHYSDLLEKHENVEILIDIFAQKISGVVLVIFAIIKYLIPVLQKII
jgi:hypothetical protein